MRVERGYQIQSRPSARHTLAGASPRSGAPGIILKVSVVLAHVLGVALLVYVNATMSLEEKIRGLTKERDDYRLKMNAHIKEKEGLARKVKEMEPTVEIHKKEHEDLVHEVGKNKRLEDEIVQLKSDVEKLEAHDAEVQAIATKHEKDLEDERKKEKDKVKGLEKMVGSLSKEKDGLAQKVTKLEASNMSLGDKVKGLEAENANLKDSHHKIHDIAEKVTP